MDFLPDDIQPVQEQAKKYPGGRKAGGVNAKTQQVIEMVVEHGMEPRKALMIVHDDPNPSRHQLRRIKEKVARWSIERPAAQKIAHSTLLKFASGNAVNGIEPKAVDVRACAERIIDQSTPITRRTESININVDVHPVDLSQFM